MAYHDLRDYLGHLESSGQLRRIDEPVATELETTSLCVRALRAEGPALLFERPGSSSHSLLGNLFGHRRRIEAALAGRPLASLRERYSGCLCLVCLASLSLNPPMPPAATPHRVD